MNERSRELMRQVLQPAMHQKLLIRAAELVELGWTRGTAARDATGQKVRSTSPQAAAWCVVGAVDRALYELLNLDVYDLLGLEVDAYDTTPCPLEILNELRRPLQRVLGRRDLTHWNDHVCPGPVGAEQLLRQAAAERSPVVDGVGTATAIRREIGPDRKGRAPRDEARRRASCPVRNHCAPDGRA